MEQIESEKVFEAFRNGNNPFNKTDAEGMMDGEERMDEEMPMMEERSDFAIIKEDEAVPLAAGRDNQQKIVKSKYTAPSGVSQDEVGGDSE